RSGTSWQNTLISGDGIHPTGGAAAADPYTPGGDPSTHTTGTNCTNDGYLLRSWLTMQKLKEVKSYVIDNAAVPGPGPGPGPAPASAPKNSGGGGGGCGLTGLEAVALLVLLRAARKSGF
ncbi:MAG: hypothetical protein HY293_21025, partial [Planctomycetes bacterium]|nr:hypothetical protein [Planctomycetota bacterium]